VGASKLGDGSDEGVASGALRQWQADAQAPSGEFAECSGQGAACRQQCLVVLGAQGTIWMALHTLLPSTSSARDQIRNCRVQRFMPGIYEAGIGKSKWRAFEKQIKGGPPDCSDGPLRVRGWLVGLRGPGVWKRVLPLERVRNLRLQRCDLDHTKGMNLPVFRP